ncbi:YtxH domain-containing protein [Spongiactinospora rosea]|uniref:YtxH domain-containing protein n=1 Tax=Spongiactinospora rosea TaxID=2248750 RepID=A0A366M1R7_9ACTN|nr:YtxH domain-containing protein [Spongiactinospora rosea]RBQ19977.1 YtxH domain-containing protein [Spongiactinospora rosea]
MRYRATFAIGLAVGYVLGSRAGRERYEQIKRTAQRVVDSPAVQEAAGLFGARVSQAAGAARSKAENVLGDRVPFLHKEDDTSDVWNQESHPVNRGGPRRGQMP